MIELIKGLPDNVVGILARGRVTYEECNDVLRPAMEVSIRRHDKLRLYYEIGCRFPGAGWDDVDITIDHLPHWERIAIVTDTGWVRHTVNALRFLLASEVRVFTIDEIEEGRAWITAPTCAVQHDLAQHEGGLHLKGRRAMAALSNSHRHCDHGALRFDRCPPATVGTNRDRIRPQELK